MAPTESDLPFFHLPQQGEWGVTHSPEIGATLVWLFYDNIMITLATDLVQKFYMYWKIRDNQAVLII